MKLKIDSEKVLALAESCSDWKPGLKILFPDIFKERENKLARIEPSDFTIGTSGDFPGGVCVYRKLKGGESVALCWIVNINCVHQKAYQRRINLNGQFDLIV